MFYFGFFNVSNPIRKNTAKICADECLLCIPYTQKVFINLNYRHFRYLILLEVILKVANGAKTK